MTQAVAREFRWPVRVYYEDTDAGGVVYHASYLRFMERARTEWLRARGFEQDRLRVEYDLLLVVHDVALQFLQPARFDDQLSVTVALTGCGGARVALTQAVLRPRDAAVCCRATLNVASVSASRWRPRRLPAVLRTELRDGF